MQKTTSKEVQAISSRPNRRQPSPYNHQQTCRSEAVSSGLAVHRWTLKSIKVVCTLHSMNCRCCRFCCFAATADAAALSVACTKCPDISEDLNWSKNYKKAKAKARDYKTKPKLAEKQQHVRCNNNTIESGCSKTCLPFTAERRGWWVAAADAGPFLARFACLCWGYAFVCAFLLCKFWPAPLNPTVASLFWLFCAACFHVVR